MMAISRKFRTCVLLNFLVASVVTKDCQDGNQCGQATEDSEEQSLLQARKAVVQLHQPNEKPNVATLPADDTCKDVFNDPTISTVDFSLSKVVHSNLGGHGPNKDAPEEIYYSNVAWDAVTHKQVDLKVVDTSKYEAVGTPYNGLHGDFGKVMMKDGTSLDLTFTFVDPDDKSPVSLNKFYFTVLDFDFGSPAGEDQETLIMEPVYSRYFLTQATEIIVSDTACVHSSMKCKSFGASTRGTDADNPSDGMDLSMQQANRAVGFVFENKSEFSLTLGIGFLRGDFNRVFFFQGQTEMSLQDHPDCCPEHVCQPDIPEEPAIFIVTQPPTSTDDTCFPDSTYVRLALAEVVYNNLGGQGPEKDQPEIMRFKHAAKTPDGTDVDLVVETLGGGYTPFDSTENGLLTDFINFNLAADSEIELKISFVDSSITDSLSYVKMDRFEMTIWDIDQKKNLVEIVTVNGYENYYVVPGYEFKIAEAENESTSFSSTHLGKECDNPIDRNDLGEQCGVDLAKRSVMFEFKDTTGFTLKLGVEGGKNGRNFLLSGAAAALCPSPTCQDECSTFSDDICKYAGCAACSDCRDDSKDTVLDTTTASCHPGSARTRLSLAEVVSNNLGGQGPETDQPEMIRIKHAAMSAEGKNLDLVIEALGEGYMPHNAASNGLNVDFLEINLADEHEVELDIRFVDSSITESLSYVTLSSFEMTLYDIDQSSTGGQESYTIDKYEKYHVIPGYEFNIAEPNDGSGATFVSSHFGNACDNPGDRHDMGVVVCADANGKTERSIKKVARAVLFEFKDASGFKLKFGVGGNFNGKKGSGGRNMLLGGATPILCP